MQKRPFVLPTSREPNVRPSQRTGFGNLLRKHRSQAGYSQGYLAEKARVSLETIGALERGARRAPYPETLELLIGALELTGQERVAFETAAAVARVKANGGKAGAGERANLLPAQLTSLVGRTDHIDKLTTLVANHRLVTVTGCSGVGKTRVVQEFAVRYRQSVSEDVRLVDLAACDDSASVPIQIARVIGESRMRERSAAGLAAALATRSMLLVFDNCEHVIAETSATTLTLIRECPGVRVLAASSERLGISGETLFRLSPLSLPDHVPESLEEARRYSAVALFIERAEAHSNVVIRADGLRRCVEICRRLDGIPGAIELAAARLAALGFENLLLRLNERLVLTGGGSDLAKRKQAPREAIGWSYAGLSTLEQILFRRLATFAARFTLEDVEAVCAQDALDRARVPGLLDSLVHKSLVAVTRSDSTVSYRMLEVARSYGREKLAEAGELERSLEHHARWLGADSHEA